MIKPEEQEKENDPHPKMEDYGYYFARSYEEESGWMYDEGEEKYYEAVRQWEERNLSDLGSELTIKEEGN
ncbi:hypothetical protein [Chryseobacterium proteolyticum]|uniref:hypothetical protein n=1 Tax=Chryseobacterium proteolyticum TaxID=118127 RepID=UPI0039832A19